MRPEVDRYHARLRREKAPANLHVLAAGEKIRSPACSTGPGAPRRRSRADVKPPSSSGTRRKKRLVVVTRDDVGPAPSTGAASPGAARIAQRSKLVDGTARSRFRTHFSLLEQYLNDNMTPADVGKITRRTGQRPSSRWRRRSRPTGEKTLFANGMGPNQFFNNDLKDRTILLVAALTGNARIAPWQRRQLRRQLPRAAHPRCSTPAGLLGRDPFNPQLDPAGPGDGRRGTCTTRSLHYYYNYGDRPLRQGNTLFTGKGHLPTPTKAMWLNNA